MGVQWQKDRAPLVSYKAHMKAHRSGEEAYHGKKQGKHGRTARHRTVRQAPVTAPARRIGKALKARIAAAPSTREKLAGQTCPKQPTSANTRPIATIRDPQPQQQ